MMEEIKTCKVAHYIPIQKLKFHPQNRELRTITRDRLDDLKESILTKGFYEPILIWKKGGIVLAGEHRTRAALELIEEGYEFVTPSGKKNHLPVVVEDVDKKTAVQILHESNNHYATWIEDRLARALTEAEKAGEDLKKYGYSVPEIDRLLQSALEEVEEVLEDTGDLPDPGDDPVKKEKPLEQYDTLTLPKPVHIELMNILEKISKQINSHWKIGDSVTEAVQALIKLIDESGALDEKEEPEPTTKRRTVEAKTLRKKKKWNGKEEGQE